MNLESLLIRVVIFVMAVVLHEYAHAWTAVRLGDPTPRWQGRLTLNPARHLSLLGTLMLVLVGLGWANPVPVNPRNFRNPKSDMVLVALAGPAVNLALAGAFALLFHVLLPALAGGPFWLPAARVTLEGAYLNALLFVFNLIPIPPLDGSKVLGRFLPPRWLYSYMQLEQYGFVVLFLLLAVFNLDRAIGWAASGVLRLFGMI